MDITVSVEKTSSITRKLKIKVPAKFVAARFEKGLQEVQKTAKIKGFRPGMVPLPMVKQFYGEDVKHHVFHKLIDESYAEALKKENIRAVGQPQIETPDHNTGKGEHDHKLDEGKDLSFEATVEILPEFEPKGYTGLALTKESVSVTDEDLKKAITNVLSSQSSVSTIEDADHKAKKGDYVDLEFKGGIVTDKGIEERPGMKGQRLIEIGSDSLIEGFEDNLVGMKKGESKTFKVPFPKDYFEKELAGKQAEFACTIHEIKKKELPKFDDEFAKNFGIDSAKELEGKIREDLENEKKSESDKKLRSDLLSQLIEKNKFEVPIGLIQAQTRALAQDVAANLKNQGFTDQMIQEALGTEMESLKKRAENQVRASLILESIAKAEKIEVTAKDVDAEITNMSKNMRVEESKVREFYHANPRRRDDMEFRLREEKAIQFLFGKSKIKEK